MYRLVPQNIKVRKFLPYNRAVTLELVGTLHEVAMSPGEGGVCLPCDTAGELGQTDFILDLSMGLQAASVEREVFYEKKQETLERDEWRIFSCPVGKQ